MFKPTLQTPGELIILAGKLVPKIDIDEQIVAFLVAFMVLLYYDGNIILIESVVIRLTLNVVTLKIYEEVLRNLGLIGVMLFIVRVIRFAKLKVQQVLVSIRNTLLR